MTPTRKRKFRRWAEKGIPKRAPLSEKRAFGAFLTNRGKRNVKAAKLTPKGRAKRINTKNTTGYEREFIINKPLSTLDDLQWRGKISGIAEGFRKTKRSKVVFIRLLLRLSLAITYINVEIEETDDGYALKWVGSREGHDSESVLSSFNELCDRVLEGVGDSRDGMVDLLSIYTLKGKRVKRT